MNNFDIPSSSTELHQFDVKWALIALFGILVSIFMALTFSVLRMGLSTPVALVPSAVAILTAAALAPLLLPYRGWLADLRLRSITFPLISLFILASLSLVFVVGKAILPLYFMVALAGLIRAFKIARHISTWRGWGGLLVSTAITATYLFVVIHNRDCAGVFTPEQGLLGLLNHDTRFHATIAFLIQNFGMPSLGVDGMLPLKYHFGSHIWFAAFGLLAGAEPLWSYAAGVLIVGVPALLLALLFAGMAIDEGRKEPRAYLCIGLLLLFLSDVIGWNSYYISESYTFGLIGMLLLLPLFVRLTKENNSPAFTRWAFFVSVLAIPFLMSLKVSVGILWGVGVGWFSLRRFGFRLPAVAIGGGCILALLMGLKLFAPSAGDYVYTNGSLIMPFYLLRVYPEVKTLSSFVFPICLILFTYAGAKAGFRQMIVPAKTDLLVETIALITIVGALPAFLGLPQDSAAWYFLNVGQWYAMAVLISRVTNHNFEELRDRLAAVRLAGPFMFIVLFVFLGQFVTLITPTFRQSVGNLVRAADQQGGEFLGGRTVAQYLSDSIKHEHVLFGTDFRNALANSIGSRLIKETHSAIDSPRPDFAVFIPPENEAFWKFQVDCRDKHNIQVALSGQPSLFGEPPKTYNCDRDAYQTNYGQNTDSREMSDADVCTHARERKIRDVLVLESFDHKEANRILHCEK